MLIPKNIIFFEKEQQIFVHVDLEIIHDCEVFLGVIGSDNATICTEIPKTTENVVKKACFPFPSFTAKKNYKPFFFGFSEK